ncbi:IrmA family protein [Yersinia kristensenii]|uniref:IrmA family protein n=1 Tax=Yersinia kristensenii TaxID=28152 RepID=UPI0005E42A62|nr:IrmA family protein [Yersinia kristensenii]MDA5473026.1 IrmA family protein [Yersinia kristensenii]MDA5477725.1 IrmA family protein [Yersinia kristensenii]MDA5506756.1 IrmA family protein [Yersinia kristensenii]MDA5524566.1 IrmA family protein [Yersinia kristensenii]MDR4896598.1 IrmA family protein [Yersinia kristensenii]
MKQTVKLLLASLLLGLGWHSASLAEEQRYISIRNTDSLWTQGVCFLVFRLDNGGVGEFSNLSVTIQLNDKRGRSLSEGTLDVPPFGDSDATRSVDTTTEFNCEALENASTISIIAASEISGNNTRVNLPLSTFDPQYYQPLKIKVSQRE